ncbi:MAG: pyridoxamine kinase [Treponemataceae bacterium]|nr:pyridoxamine kinase [Treponemataceae bacterium]
MESHNNQKKIALINDYSGFGRCSVVVQLPVISKLKIQCCPLPTSIFSNHTGFPSYSYQDYTCYMAEYIENWKKLDLHFKGICTGFLGSAEQIQIVKDFISDFKKSDTIVVIDPVMGDYGKPYPTYTEQMCSKMKELVPYADIITPNLTEACIVAGIPYKDSWSLKELRELALKLSQMGPEKVVITGIPQKSFLCNFCYDSKADENKFGMIKTHKVGTSRSGTGDVFTAIVAADAVNGLEFRTSVRKASRFIKKCIIKSIEMEIPVTDGVPFEEVLDYLK